jgi:hypothetical protein
MAENEHGTCGTYFSNLWFNWWWDALLQHCFPIHHLEEWVHQDGVCTTVRSQTASWITGQELKVTRHG